MISRVVKRTAPTRSEGHHVSKQGTGEWRFAVHVEHGSTYGPRMFGLVFKSGGWNPELTEQGWRMWAITIGYLFGELKIRVEFTDRPYHRGKK